MIHIGDKVKNIKSGEIGIVIRKFKSGSIGVLEKVNPTVICTHDNEKTLEVMKEAHVDIFDKTNDEEVKFKDLENKTFIDLENEKFK